MPDNKPDRTYRDHLLVIVDGHAELYEITTPTGGVSHGASLASLPGVELSVIRMTADYRAEQITWDRYLSSIDDIVENFNSEVVRSDTPDPAKPTRTYKYQTVNDDKLVIAANMVYAITGTRPAITYGDSSGSLSFLFQGNPDIDLSRVTHRGVGVTIVD